MCEEFRWQVSRKPRQVLFGPLPLFFQEPLRPAHRIIRSRGLQSNDMGQIGIRAAHESQHLFVVHQRLLGSTVSRGEASASGAVGTVGVIVNAVAQLRHLQSRIAGMFARISRSAD
jgi:hypothetical protein